MTMFRVSFLTTLVAFILCLPAPVWAQCHWQEGYCHQALNCLEFHADEYGGKVVHKAGSGAANIVAALTLTDVGDGVSNGIEFDDELLPSVIGGTMGGLVGLGKGVYRLTAGLAELGTAPLPFLGPFRYPRKNYFDGYCEPTPYGTVSPFAIITSIVGE